MLKLAGLTTLNQKIGYARFVTRTQLKMKFTCNSIAMYITMKETIGLKI